jgi:hypothetical protein
MLVEYFRGQPAALVADRDQIEVQYVAPPRRAAIESDPSAVIYAMTTQQVRAALELGTVVSVERGEGAAPWRVALQHEGTALEAAFFPSNRDRGSDRELAAAALDDLLGTDLIAPTVARTIDGEDGALQLRHRGTVTEAFRAARGLAFSGWCPLEPQLGLMYTFDALLSNRGRGADNVLFANDLTDLLLTDHRQAFGTERALPSRLEASRLGMPQALVARLRALDERQLAMALGARLDSRQISALLERRDRLLRLRPVQ